MRSDEVEVYVDAIVGKARDTAATILAEARAEAAASAVRPAVPATPTRAPVPEEAIRSAVPVPPLLVPEPVPARASLAAMPVEPPPTNGGSTHPPTNGAGTATGLPTTPETNGHAGADARPEFDWSGHVEPTRPAGDHAVGTNGNGAAADPTASPRPKTSHFPSLRRRHRARAADPEPDTSDEFLDFLRGALIDDTPLAQGSDSEVQWRWTP